MPELSPDPDQVFKELDFQRIYSWSFEDKYRSTAHSRTLDRHYLNSEFSPRAAAQYIAIEQFVRDIASNETPGYKISKSDEGRIYLKTSLAENIKKLGRGLPNIDPSLQFSGNIESFQSVFGDFDLRLFSAPQKTYPGTSLSCGDVFNDLVTQVRSLAQSGEILSRTRRRGRKCRDRYNGTIEFLDKILSSNQTISCLWLDLLYGEGFNLKEAKRRLGHLLNNHRRNKTFKPAIGYIWRLEYDIQLGYHFYLFYVFDRTLDDDGQVLAGKIERYWCDIVTKGSGAYFTHEPSTKDHWFSGLSNIERENKESVRLLYRAAAYLAKKDLYIEIPNSAGKSYGLGWRNEGISN